MSFIRRNAIKPDPDQETPEQLDKRKFDRIFFWVTETTEEDTFKKSLPPDTKAAWSQKTMAHFNDTLFTQLITMYGIPQDEYQWYRILSDRWLYITEIVCMRDTIEKAITSGLYTNILASQIQQQDLARRELNSLNSLFDQHDIHLPLPQPSNDGTFSLEDQERILLRYQVLNEYLTNGVMKEEAGWFRAPNKLMGSGGHLGASSKLKDVLIGLLHASGRQSVATKAEV